MNTDQERAGRNEAIFRQVNEQIEQVNRTFWVAEQTLDLFCECAELACTERIAMTVAEYERLRADASTFAVKPEHERPDVEDVVEERPGYVVVRKHEGDAARVARATAPRGS